MRLFGTNLTLQVTLTIYKDWRGLSCILQASSIARVYSASLCAGMRLDGVLRRTVSLEDDVLDKSALSEERDGGPLAAGKTCL